MRKIRIGNDIRLKLKIEPNTQAGFDKIDEFDQSSVKQLRCYLINTSICNCGKEDGPKPFKRVGFPEFYHPSHHNINNCGFPSYHMKPANMCNYDRFEPDFHDFHWWPGYRGFGLRPERFHDHCCHIQHGPRPKPSCCGFGWWDNCWRDHHSPFFDYHCFDDCCGPHCDHCWEPFNPQVCPCDPPCEHPHHPEPEPYDITGRPAEWHFHQNMCWPIYLADSQVLPTKNTLTCFFPAVQQGMCGEYKLVVVLTVFEQGWGRHNLRTYTIDKGLVFELVDEGGESGDIYLDVDDTGDDENLIDSIWTEEAEYTIATNSQVLLGGYDLYDKQYNIYLKLKDGSVVLYNGNNPNIAKLTFTSDDEEALTVDKDGTLHGMDFDEVLRETHVTVADKNNTVSYTFTVNVKKIDTIKIGFLDNSNIELLDVNDSDLNEYDVKAISYSIPNSIDGDYLWVVSQRRIHYIKSIEPEMDLVSELSSGIRVPMINGVIKDGYYCYRSVSPILAGQMNIKIKFA